MLDGPNGKGSVETKVWDKQELDSILLHQQFFDLIERHLPMSFAAHTRPEELSQVLSAFEASVPGSIFEKVREVDTDTSRMKV